MLDFQNKTNLVLKNNPRLIDQEISKQRKLLKILISQKLSMENQEYTSESIARIGKDLEQQRGLLTTLESLR